MQSSFTIEFIEHRCWKCGTFFAIEKGCDSDNCPTCVQRDLVNMRDSMNRMCRRMHGLEASITRMKRRAK